MNNRIIYYKGLFTNYIIDDIVFEHRKQAKLVLLRHIIELLENKFIHISPTQQHLTKLSLGIFEPLAQIQICLWISPNKGLTMYNEHMSWH